MSDGKQITEFLRDRIGNLGISSLVLVVLEKMMDNDFVCPCQPGFNEWICVCYAVVPFITCFFITLFFMDSKPEDKVMKGNSTCNKVLYSFLTSFIWLFLFFFDGNYVACACSHWGGEYTETGALKWCKPKGNETEVLGLLQETQRYITKSQFAAFAIVLVITSILVTSCCCRLHCCHVRCHGHCNSCFIPDCEHCCNGDQQTGDVSLRGSAGEAR
ncbi:uncharacterized protein LOC132841026 [Tachysurus vachellii]|nr:uncharacterized protein LOC132841026 [Tachysurus vachellii]